MAVFERPTTAAAIDAACEWLREHGRGRMTKLAAAREEIRRLRADNKRLLAALRGQVRLCETCNGEGVITAEMNGAPLVMPCPNCGDARAIIEEMA
jgi:DnaJ-class molecular chaperone